MSNNLEWSLNDLRRKRLEEDENIRRWLKSSRERQYLEAEFEKQKADEERLATLH